MHLYISSRRSSLRDIMLDAKAKNFTIAGLALLGIAAAAGLDWAQYMKSGHFIFFLYGLGGFIFWFIVILVVAGSAVLAAAYHRNEMAMKGDATPRVIEREKTIVIVKIKCQHCGMLVENTASTCPNCASIM